MKTREELLRSKGYWTSELQMELFSEIEKFMNYNNMNRTQLAEYLGCTKGYVTQLLAGDFDNKLSKFVELCLAIGKIPQVSYKDINAVILQDEKKYSGESDIVFHVYKNVYKQESAFTPNAA